MGLLVLGILIGCPLGWGLSKLPTLLPLWHQAIHRAGWRWKSRWHGGRPRIRELRELIQRISLENPLWGAPRIHGELLKLGFQVSQSTVSRYMARRAGRPTQNWKTFLRDHADGIASIDMLVVPTAALECHYVFVVLGHGRRRILYLEVTAHPTALWLAQQMREAFPWDARVPHFLIRDNDGAYGAVFRRRLWAMGIRDHPTTPSFAVAERPC